MKKNDKVLVITGKDKGKLGIVLKMIGAYAVVGGINLYKKHLKADPNKQIAAGIFPKEIPLHISNLKVTHD